MFLVLCKKMTMMMMMTFVRNCLADCADLAGLGDSFQVGPVVE